MSDLNRSSTLFVGSSGSNSSCSNVVTLFLVGLEETLLLELVLRALGVLTELIPFTPLHLGYFGQPQKAFPEFLPWRAILRTICEPQFGQEGFISLTA